ncbi:MAG: 4Fe-4S binding protein [Candidatus Omnitrophota bacterium]|nr:4Fe-4S binding protein [Candidatus Omnitrophota bacterium]
MAKRKIIKIDEKKCNGCGLCIPNCPEGAMQIINGKARLVSDLFCDGLGACIGKCPKGAIFVEEREAKDYDEKKVMENIVKQGKETIAAHLKHLKEHGQKQYLQEALDFLKAKAITIPKEEIMSKNECGCPGSKMIDIKRKTKNINGQPQRLHSELRQWPIQLHLLNPSAPYFKEANLLIAADCVSFSYANFHQRLLKGKILIIFCPKLDNAKDVYVEKLTQIIKNNEIKSLTLVHMEVPCCFGLVSIAEEAVKALGKNIIIKNYTISIKGDII